MKNILKEKGVKVFQDIQDSWDGTIKDINVITGQKKVVYVLWGESPESPEFFKYGFETEDEARAFMCGVEEMNGWMGYTSAYSAETFGKDNVYQAQTQEEFAKEIRLEHDFEEGA